MKKSSSIENNKIGNEIHAFIENNLYIQKNGDVFDRVNSIEVELNNIRAPKLPLKVHVPWYGKILAFTCPGQHIYISPNGANVQK